MTNLDKVIEDYNSINTTTDLIKRDLTYYELIVIKECMKEISSKGFAINCITSVNEYFKKFGFTIAKFNNIFYKIKIPKK